MITQPKQGPTRYLRCLTWNADGLKHQYYETIHFLLKNNIDIAFINETHLKPHINIAENRYKMYRLDRIDMQKGGLLILHKHTILSEKK